MAFSQYIKPIKKAFTLIELLIVISIIALLMAIMVPCLNIAKIKAKATQCLANADQLVLAWQMYATANHSNIVSGDVQPVGKSTWLCHPVDEYGVTYEQDATLEDKLRGIREGALFPYVETTDVYRCPADNCKLEKETYYSYIISASMNGEPPIEGDVDLRVNKDTSISRPSEKLVFAEKSEMNGWRKRSFVINYNASFWKDKLAFFHRNTTLAFADGHAELHEWQDDRTVDWLESGWVLEKHENSPDFEFIKWAYNPRK